MYHFVWLYTFLCTFVVMPYNAHKKSKLACMYEYCITIRTYVYACAWSNCNRMCYTLSCVVSVLHVAVLANYLNPVYEKCPYCVTCMRMRVGYPVKCW